MAFSFSIPCDSLKENIGDITRSSGGKKLGLVPHFQIGHDIDRDEPLKRYRRVSGVHTIEFAAAHSAFNKCSEGLMVPTMNRREIDGVIFREGEGKRHDKAYQIRCCQAESEVSGDHLVDLYDGGAISRRQLLQGLLALGMCGGAAGEVLATPPPEPPLRTRTINHVTIYASDVARSKAFYQRVAGLAVRDEAKDFCEFRLEGGFLGLYAPRAGARSGFDHFCFGIEAYDAKRVHTLLTEAVPDSHPTIEYEDQVYVRDPDGVRVQFSDVAYKR